MATEIPQKEFIHEANAKKRVIKNPQRALIRDTGAQVKELLPAQEKRFKSPPPAKKPHKRKRLILQRLK